MEATLFLDRDGPVLSIEFNRPERRNALTIAMRGEIYEALTLVRDDPSILVVVFSGRGPCFCAGADLTEFGTAPPPLEARDVRSDRDLWSLLAGLDALLIAALHGPVLGTGLELALLCDIRIAAPGSSLGLPETRLGMVPAAGGSQTLPRAIGASTAREMLLRGEPCDARTALEYGLVAEIVEAGDLLRRALEIGHRSAAGRAVSDPRRQLLRRRRNR